MDIRAWQEINATKDKVESLESSLKQLFNGTDHSETLARIEKLEGEVRAIKMRMGKNPG